MASAATLGGNLGGAFDLTTGGAAELTLSGVNSFSGITTVNGGILTLAGGAALADTMGVT
ncbi:MAG: autotransporter-associated beta strand repeat-containing protein, partial [bacterium]